MTRMSPRRGGQSHWLLPSMLILATLGVAMSVMPNKASAADPTIAAPPPTSGSRVAPTADQLRNYKPIPWYAPINVPKPPANERAVIGKPGQSPPGLPDPRAAAEARAAQDPNIDSQSTGSRADFGSADTYTPYCANCGSGDRVKSPHQAIGLLTFTNPRTGGGGSCTASVVSPNNIIVTAAHCLYQRGAGWYANWRFYPAYKSGQHPTYLSFPYTTGRVLSNWISVGARRDDVGVLRLGNNTAGRSVTFYTGWLGRQWNWPTTRSIHALGYPGNIGGGQLLELCAAETSGANVFCAGDTVLNMGCNMTFGASGGPWLNGYRGGNWVNSVVSGHDSAFCTGTFGQNFNSGRFTDYNIVTLCNAIGC